MNSIHISIQQLVFFSLGSQFFQTTIFFSKPNQSKWKKLIVLQQFRKYLFSIFNIYGNKG